MNRHAYDPSARVSRSTPYTWLMFTSLFAMRLVFGASSPSPPVPMMISRIPFAESATPSGVCGAKRS